MIWLHSFNNVQVWTNPCVRFVLCTFCSSIRSFVERSHRTTQNPTHFDSIEIKRRLCRFETTTYYVLLPMLLFIKRTLSPQVAWIIFCISAPISSAVIWEEGDLTAWEFVAQSWHWSEMFMAAVYHSSVSTTRAIWSQLLDELSVLHVYK